MKTATRSQDRDALLRQAERDTRRTKRLIDTLLEAFAQDDEAPPALGSKLEELRHKRDTVLTKLEALRRHRRAGWSLAIDELDRARHELRQAWRSVLGILDKESLFL